MPTDGSAAARPLIDTPFFTGHAQLSPDGRWLAYVADEMGHGEVYVRPFPHTDGSRWRVSDGGGEQPVWARDGRELFYLNGEAVMAVSIDTEPSFAAGNPEVVFEGQYFGEQGGRAYDVSPDGERFLMIKPVESMSITSQIIIVQNWFEELNRLAPPSE